MVVVTSFEQKTTAFRSLRRKFPGPVSKLERREMSHIGGKKHHKTSIELSSCGVRMSQAVVAERTRESEVGCSGCSPCFWYGHGHAFVDIIPSCDNHRTSQKVFKTWQKSCDLFGKVWVEGNIPDPCQPSDSVRSWASQVSGRRHPFWARSGWLWHRTRQATERATAANGFNGSISIAHVGARCPGTPKVVHLMALESTRLRRPNKKKHIRGGRLLGRVS